MKMRLGIRLSEKMYRVADMEITRDELLELDASEFVRRFLLPMFMGIRRSIYRNAEEGEQEEKEVN